MRKVLDILSVLAFILSASLGAGSFFAYRWATSPKTHEALKQKILSEIPIPGVGALTGPAQLLPEKKALSTPSISIPGL